MGACTKCGKTPAQYAAADVEPYTSTFSDTEKDYTIIMTSRMESNVKSTDMGSEKSSQKQVMSTTEPEKTLLSGVIVSR